MKKAPSKSKQPASGGGILSAVRRTSKPANPQQQIAALFSKYEDEDQKDIMEMDGISQLGEDLGLNPSEDVEILVLCWKLGVKGSGRITRAEFQAGMEALGVSSIEELQALLPSFKPADMSAADYREFYKFVFQFTREGTNKTIEKDVVMSLLPMVLGARSEHTPRLLEFLQQSAGNTRITFDQWCNFLDFSNTVKLDMTGYSEDGAWPVLLDEYVEYCRAHPK